ncbi:MAG: hypothetical protein ABIV48_06165, partial [Pyrinomonadaceae bacterium]
CRCRDICSVIFVYHTLGTRLCVGLYTGPISIYGFCKNRERADRNCFCGFNDPRPGFLAAQVTPLEFIKLTPKTGDCNIDFEERE